MEGRKPLILIANDDGIIAPGIRVLIEEMVSFGDVVVVAPDKPQSGTGHGITIESPLRYNEVDVGFDCKAYSCSGTPVDCVKLAVNIILPEKPDLVVSGINHGSNSSINVIYSGTMSAAVEGALEGVPSLGFSLLDYSFEADFSVSRKVVRAIVKNTLQSGLPKGTCLNVNIPKIESSNFKGIKVCRQANANWEQEFDERVDPTGKKYFWLTGVFKNYDEGTDTDEWALANGYASVVPVQYDLTAYDSMSELKNRNYEI